MIELEKVNEENTKLFAIIAHDVKGPIETMRMAMAYINEHRSTIGKNKMDFLLTTFEQELGTVSDLLNNLLTWAKERHYGLMVYRTKLSLHEEVEASFWALHGLAAQKDIRMVNNVDKDLIVSTDKEMLQVILRNLISNAIKFSYPSTLVNIESLPGINTVLVSVSDSGTGMYDAIRQKILHNERVDSKNGTATEKGVGLGLSICKEFIEKLGGGMNISCTEGKGTVVYFTLPI